MPKKTPHRFHPCPKRNGIGSERNKRINAEDFLDYRLRSGDLDYSRRRDVDRFQPSRRRKSMQIASLLFCFLSIVSLVRSVLRSKLIRICSAAVGRRRGCAGGLSGRIRNRKKGVAPPPDFIVSTPRYRHGHLLRSIIARFGPNLLSGKSEVRN